jgi:hypothetical protein
MRRKPYPFVHSIVDRYGRTHHYLRRRGFPSVTLPGPIGSRQFLEAYQAALAEASSTVGRAASGTVAALVKLYYASPEWLTLALQSQRTYRNILESFVAEHGDKSVRALSVNTSRQWSMPRRPRLQRRINFASSYLF